MGFIKAPYRGQHVPIHPHLFSAVFNGGNGGLRKTQVI